MQKLLYVLNELELRKNFPEWLDQLGIKPTQPQTSWDLG